MNIREKELLIRSLREQADVLEVSIKQKNAELSSIRKRIKSLKESLSKSNGPLKVTDHAVCQYMDRVIGFDMEAIREEIKGSLTKQSPNGKYPSSSGRGTFHVVVRNGNLITVMADKKLEK